MVADGMAGYEMDKDDVLARLGRIEGQVRGVAQMIEQDATASTC
jgi:DNA-binding FrmR family transcriptional regulator